MFLFFSGDNCGDVCESDWDLDNTPNYLDNCPNNSKIFSTDFRYAGEKHLVLFKRNLSPDFFNDKQTFIRARIYTLFFIT